MAKYQRSAAVFANGLGSEDDGFLADKNRCKKRSLPFITGLIKLFNYSSISFISSCDTHGEIIGNTLLHYPFPLDYKLSPKLSLNTP